MRDPLRVAVVILSAGRRDVHEVGGELRGKAGGKAVGARRLNAVARQTGRKLLVRGGDATGHQVDEGLPILRVRVAVASSENPPHALFGSVAL